MPPLASEEKPQFQIDQGACSFWPCQVRNNALFLFVLASGVELRGKGLGWTLDGLSLASVCY